MMIDQRFLTVHPATMTWWDQRERCETCRHLKLSEGTEGEGIMRCRKSPSPGRPGAEFCLDARSGDGLCGPEARLYELKEQI